MSNDPQHISAQFQHKEKGR